MGGLIDNLSPTFAKPLQLNDAEQLRPIDEAYARYFKVETRLTRGSLSFYVRTGHAFVAVRKSEMVGFVLAQAVWNGTRPTLLVDYMPVAKMQDLVARLAMLEAVTKSAYDAAVYDIQVQIFTKDTVAIQSLIEKQYDEKELRIYERILGSRSAK